MAQVAHSHSVLDFAQRSWDGNSKSSHTLTHCCLDDVGATEELRVNEWCDVTQRVFSAILRGACRSKGTGKAGNGGGGKWLWLEEKYCHHTHQGSTICIYVYIYIYRWTIIQKGLSEVLLRSAWPLGMYMR